MRTFSTMIMAGGRGERLMPLTARRAKPAIRFGGVYRIIDFTLSNCVNSGIRHVYLLTQFASTSLERHVRHGWAPLFRSEFGEVIETRPPQQLSGREWYSGTADSILKNLDLIGSAEGILVLSGDHIYTMDYRRMITSHHEEGADLTIACCPFPIEQARDLGVVEVGVAMRLSSFAEKPDQPQHMPDDQNRALCNMGVYFFSRDALVEALRGDEEDGASAHDFGRDVIPALLQRGARVMAYHFVDENRKEAPYWRDIGTLDAYYEASMDLVTVDPVLNLYNAEWPIRCWLPQLPPAKTVFDWPDANRVGRATDSLVSPGVIISGSRVGRSILSPGVRIHSWAEVSDSILFDDVEVGRGAVVHRAILDTGVRIAPGERIVAGEVEGRPDVTVTSNGVCVVSR